MYISGILLNRWLLLFLLLSAPTWKICLFFSCHHWFFLFYMFIQLPIKLIIFYCLCLLPSWIWTIIICSYYTFLALFSFHIIMLYLSANVLYAWLMHRWSIQLFRSAPWFLGDACFVADILYLCFWVCFIMVMINIHVWLFLFIH